MTDDRALEERLDDPFRVRSTKAKNDVVLLVHGIRDYALWQGAIRSTLEKADFEVELTNYGRFNLIKFLLPISFFRRQAMDDVERQIRIVVQKNRNRNRPISTLRTVLGRTSSHI